MKAENAPEQVSVKEKSSRYRFTPAADTLTAKGAAWIDNWDVHASDYTLLAIENPDLAIRQHAKQLIRHPSVPVMLVTILAESNTELFLATAGRTMLAYRHRYLDLFTALARMHPDTALKVGGEFLLAYGTELLPLYNELEQQSPQAALLNVGDLMLAHGYHTERFSRIAEQYPELTLKNYGASLIASWDRYGTLFQQLAAQHREYTYETLWRVLSTGPQPAREYYNTYLSTGPRTL